MINFFLQHMPAFWTIVALYFATAWTSVLAAGREVYIRFNGGDLWSPFLKNGSIIVFATFGTLLGLAFLAAAVVRPPAIATRTR